MMARNRNVSMSYVEYLDIVLISIITVVATYLAY
jgi:hypothetical protein